MMNAIEKEQLRDVFFEYKRYARLMCMEDADDDEIRWAVEDACEAAHACAGIQWKIVETFQHMANEVAVLEGSDPEKASKLEDTYLTYLKSL